MKAPICCLLLIALGAFFTFAESVAPTPFNATVLQTKAEAGDAEAQLELGRAYHTGRGVPQDFNKAAVLYHKSAAQGNAKAMFNLGFLYSHGQGVTTDLSAAKDWFQKAADKGLPAGELKMGMLYYTGDVGIPQDYAASAKWLTLAANHPDAPAQVGPASNALGSLYEHGWGVTMDGKRAVDWYSKGAELGYGLAQGNLGRLLHEGLIVKRDPVKSYMWLKLGSLHGDISSLHLLGEMITAKMFSDADIAEGDRLIKERQDQKSPSVRLTPPALPGSSG